MYVTTTVAGGIGYDSVGVGTAQSGMLLLLVASCCLHR